MNWYSAVIFGFTVFFFVLFLLSSPISSILIWILSDFSIEIHKLNNVTGNITSDRHIPISLLKNISEFEEPILEYNVTANIAG